MINDAALRWLADEPQLDAPTLVVMLDGWIDAAGAAAAAMAAIHDEGESSPIVSFDDDTFLDYRARRPVMELREGLNTVLQWERINLSVAHDQAGHDLLLLSGPEPDMAWHRFTSVVGALAAQFGVRHVIAMGAYPFATPHTRPSRLSVSTPSADVLAGVPFLRSSLDVPAGVAASLELEMHERSIPSLTIWAQVPHYIATASYPMASVALLDGLREAADVVIDGTQLRQDSLVQRRRLDSMVADNPEHVQMMKQLEQLYDAGDNTHPGSDTGDGSSLEMRSGDELAAEFERFLNEQD